MPKFALTQCGHTGYAQPSPVAGNVICISWARIGEKACNLYEFIQVMERDTRVPSMTQLPRASYSYGAAGTRFSTQMWHKNPVGLLKTRRKSLVCKGCILKMVSERARMQNEEYRIQNGIRRTANRASRILTSPVFCLLCSVFFTSALYSDLLYTVFSPKRKYLPLSLVSISPFLHTGCSWSLCSEGGNTRLFVAKLGKSCVKTLSMVLCRHNLLELLPDMGIISCRRAKRSRDSCPVM